MNVCKWYEICPIKEFTDSGRLDPFWTRHYCMDRWIDCVRYHMEERGEYHPDWMLPDGTIDADLKSQ